MRVQTLPSLPAGFEYRLDLRHHVTPRLLLDQPVHRWFRFPHSFSPQLVDEVLKAYPIPSNGRILDPFVGSGTTVVRARFLGYEAVGVDLSPLAILVTKAKLSCPDKGRLEKALDRVLSYRPVVKVPPLSERLRRAFTPGEIAHLLGLKREIMTLSPEERDFFLLALLRTQQRASRAEQDGGWFRWVKKPDQSREIAPWFEEQARLQIADVTPGLQPRAEVLQGDARLLQGVQGPFDLVITSPPYPNRHDYTRVFHVELLFLGLKEEEVRRLRKESLRSHVEARAPSFASSLIPTPTLRKVLEALPSGIDRRVPIMIRGYFEDMRMVLDTLKKRLNTGGIAVLVVGNVRHAGVMVPVDEILVEIAQELGYTFEGAWVARLRGNSAQQMGRFGREPARESVVFLRLPQG